MSAPSNLTSTSSSSIHLFQLSENLVERAGWEQNELKSLPLTSNDKFYKIVDALNSDLSIIDNNINIDNKNEYTKTLDSLTLAMSRLYQLSRLSEVALSTISHIIPVVNKSQNDVLTKDQLGTLIQLKTEQLNTNSSILQDGLKSLKLNYNSSELYIKNLKSLNKFWNIKKTSIKPGNFNLSVNYSNDNIIINNPILSSGSTDLLSPYIGKFQVELENKYPNLGKNNDDIKLFDLLKTVVDSSDNDEWLNVSVFLLDIVRIRKNIVSATSLSETYFSKDEFTFLFSDDEFINLLATSVLHEKAPTLKQTESLIKHLTLIKQINSELKNLDIKFSFIFVNLDESVLIIYSGPKVILRVNIYVDKIIINTKFVKLDTETNYVNPLKNETINCNELVKIINELLSF